MSSASASFNELLGVLSEALPECFNRERADACAVRLCMLNSKVAATRWIMP